LSLQAWKAAMPRVMPFYAVKCFPDAGLLRLLAALGTGFDCASKGEVEMVLKLGVHPSRIIFAHPCKRGVDIRYAREHGVEYTTFDTLSELHKIAVGNPGFKCVLRIRADDPDARVPLGLKYGAEMGDVPELLATARQLGLDVVGVSFHVGSACKNLCVFGDAIANARRIFDQAAELGYDMELLDIGGGFTGHFDSHGNVMFGEIATTINAALAAHFPPSELPGVRVIAEPGRYFAETSATLMTPVYGQRNRSNPATGELSKDYWITDGLYGRCGWVVAGAGVRHTPLACVQPALCALRCVMLT
jgi:ornithine decarboxylase